MLTFATRFVQLISLGIHNFEVFIAKDQLQHSIATIAAAINTHFEHQPVYLLVVLSGAYRFAADLSGHLIGEVELGFVKLASYHGLNRAETIEPILLPSQNELIGKNVIVVEDIVDTGHTLAYLLSLPQLQAAKTLKIASLLFKPEAFKYNFKIDYLGFDIPNKFVLGYGLDYNGLGRNLNDIYQLKEE